MNKSTFIKIVCLIIGLLIICSIFGFCTNKASSTEMGVVSSFVAENKVQDFVSTTSSFKIYTNSSVTIDELKKSISVNPKSKYSITGGNTEFTLKFNGEMKADAVYTFSSMVAGRTVYQWAFQTVKSFDITDTVLPESLKDKSITINFSYDDVDNFEENFSVTPKTEGTFKKKNNSWIFTAKDGFNAETRYSFTVKKSVKAKNGLTLSADYTDSFVTGEAEGKYIAVLRDDADYADSFISTQVPMAVIKHRDLKSKNVTANVYKFGEFKEYMSAHKTVFSTPDFSTVDTLIAKMTNVGRFEASLNDYDANISEDEIINTKMNKSMVIYPQSYECGYYLTEFIIDGEKLYHAFQVSDISVYTVTAGNTLTAWVNNSKTGKAITDAEVMLDNAYDTKTDGNGVVSFSLSNDKTEYRTLVINNPVNENLPFISSVHINVDYNEIKTKNSYNCTLMTDSLNYNENDTIKLFGTVSPINSADKAKNVKLKYLKKTITINLDADNSFLTEIELDDYSSNVFSAQLYVNGVKMTSASANVNSVSLKKSVKKSDDVYLSAKPATSGIEISAEDISNMPNNTSVYNYGASELYNSARYTLSETAEVDYTVDVVEKLLYEKNLGAEYYDNSLNKYVQRFSYERKIIKSTVDTFTGKTKNGKAMVQLEYFNDLSLGKVYEYIISYKNKSGKKISFTYTNGFDDNAYQIYDDENYTLTFAKTNNIDNAEKIEAVLTKGDEIIDKGKVLLVSGGYHLNNKTILNANSIVYEYPENESGLTVVCGAYFDGKHTYILNTNVLYSNDEGRRLNVSATVEDKKYAAGDSIDLSVKVTDNENKPVKCAVLIRMDSVNNAGFVLSNNSVNRLTDAQKYITIQSSVYSYGKSRPFDIDKSVDIVKYAEKSYLPQIFTTVSTNNNGEGKISLVAPNELAEYVVSVIAIKGVSVGRDDTIVSCTEKTPLGISSSDSISISDDFVIDVKSNISKEDLLNSANKTDENPVNNTINSKEAVTDLNSSTGNATETTITANETQINAKLTLKASLYRDVKKDEALDSKKALQTAENEIEIGANARISLGRLAAGNYAILIEYEFNERKYTQINYFTVTADNAVAVPVISTVTKSGVSPKYKSSNSVKCLIFDDGYSDLFRIALNCCKTDKNDLLSLLAKKNAEKFFGMTNADTAFAKAYQKKGISYQTNGKEDLNLSAFCAAVFQDYFDTSKLADYFEKFLSSNDTTQMLTAYWGKAALHLPILPQLYEIYDNRKSLDEEQMLLLALSFAYIGDYDKANAIFDEIVDKMTKVEDIAYFELSGQSTKRLTSLVALLTSKINNENATSFIRYIEQNNEKKSMGNIVLSQYINNFLNLGDDKIDVRISVGDDVKNASFNKSEVYRVDIKPENIDSTVVSSEQSCSVCLVYMVSENEADSVKK